MGRVSLHMNVIDCPGCGSSDVKKNTSSFEYGGSTTWRCGDCSWSYTNGSGIGVGTSNSGTHPREVGSANQRTLIQVGEYCRNCETVIAREHACSPSKVLEQSDKETMSQEDMAEELEEWHYDGARELRDSIKSGDVNLTPTFYHVTNGGSESFKEEVFEEMERIIKDQEGKPTDSWSQEDEVKLEKLQDRLAIQNEVERAFLRRILEEMRREGMIGKSMYGWSIR